MKKVIKIILAVGVLAIFVWTIVFLYKKSEKKPVVYKTKSPFKTNILKKTVATGSVVPRKEIEIKPQVSGIIQKVYVLPGQQIRKGDKIARIKIIPNMVQLNEAESRLEKARINFKNAEREKNRQEKLFKDGIIPDADYQKLLLSFSNTKAELNAAENNLYLIKEGVTKKSGKATNTVIRSTIEGMVLSVPVKEGYSVIESNTFNAGTTIAIVADMGDMIFQGKVDETEVGKIKTGMKLLLSIGAIEKEKFEAKLKYISPKGTKENGAIQFEIKADVKLKESQFIRAGYSANADIVLDRRDSVLAIEESLLIFKNDSTFVEIEISPQKFERKLIKTGLSDGINIEVLSGLTKKDKIKVIQAISENKK